MITQKLGVVQDGNWSEWRFHVNTGSLKKTGIPISLYGQPSVTVKVDWGDGSHSTLKSSNYASSNSDASIHSYDTDGIYEVILYIKNSEDLFLQYEGTQSYSTNNISYFRDTLVSVDSAIPLVAGTTRYYISQWERNQRALERVFFYCNNLTTLAVDTFYNNPQITSVGYSFRNCPLLTDFTLRFSSPYITYASGFCDSSTSATRIIYVPAGSTTETTFNDVASSLGLTIIGV